VSEQDEGKQAETEVYGKTPAEVVETVLVALIVAALVAFIIYTLWGPS
jgi:hypothetical protein